MTTRSLPLRGWLLVGAAYAVVVLIIAEPLWRP